jgi:outer membrane protein TolC
LNLARLQRDERLNIVGLYRALGGGWEAVGVPGKVAYLSRPDK